MNLSNGIRIGRIRGIDIRVHWSWLLIFGLLSWSLSQGLFGQMFVRWSQGQQWAAGAITALLFFISVLAHELSHSFVAQSYGMKVPSITLFVFGGVSNIASEMKTARQEFRVAIVGPLMSWALALGFAGLWYLTPSEGVSAIFGYLAFINGLLGAFNLLPGFPLDGGRVLRSILWARWKDLLRATRVASRVGIYVAYGMIGLGMVNVLAFGLFGGLWYVLIGLFLKSASEGSYAAVQVESALTSLSVADVMQTAPEPVHATLSLEQLIDQRLLESGTRAYLVERERVLIGLITAADVTRVARDRWPLTPVQDAMIPAERVTTVTPETGVMEALRLMQEHDVHQLPVLEDGRVVGLLSRGDVMRQIELRGTPGDRRGGRARERERERERDRTRGG